MEFPMYIVDAFTDVPFAGNPAAVCWVEDREISEETMQKLAAEMNLSETAFVVSKSNDYSKETQFGLRWFTPTNEIALCGHATLASASTVFNIANNSNSSITFSTLSGDLYARKGQEYIELDFPSNPPRKLNESEKRIADSLLPKVLGERTSDVQEAVLSTQTKKLLIRMVSGFTRADLESLQPKFKDMLTTHDGSVIKGVIVTCQAESKHPELDFYSRYFASWNGIDEDPVTGSAHTVLAPYWQAQLGKGHLQGRQCSKRGGVVRVTVREDGRVDIAGKTNILLKGSVFLPAKA